MRRSVRRAFTALALGFVFASPARAQAPSPDPAALPQVVPVTATRLVGEIKLDGVLEDAEWSGAGRIETFFETVFGDNRKPHVTTVAYVAYDAKYLYVGLRCDDPEPAKIRAPYTDRDQVFGTDDNVAVFIDTQGDKRVAQEFRVSPRGIQGDAVFNDSSGNEDFSPDFYYDAAAKITDQGWTAEMRIPFSSLRYKPVPEQQWGIMIWRNYPRDRRYAIYSSPIPRGSNCYVCNSGDLRGLLRPAHLAPSGGCALRERPGCETRRAARRPAHGGRGRVELRTRLQVDPVREHRHRPHHQSRLPPRSRPTPRRSR